MVVKEKATLMKTRTAKDTLFVCRLKPEAKTVYLVGDFNNWDTNSDRMINKGGEFQREVHLAPGEYQYKFLVDGEWYADPNADQVPNSFGSTNSIAGGGWTPERLYACPDVGMGVPSLY